MFLASGEQHTVRRPKAPSKQQQLQGLQAGVPDHMHNSSRAERPERTIGNPLSGVAPIKDAGTTFCSNTAESDASDIASGDGGGGGLSTPAGRGIGGVVGTPVYSSGGGGGIGKFTPN